MQSLFLAEAQNDDIFPLDPRMAERFDPRVRAAGEPKTGWRDFRNQVWRPDAIGPLLFPRHHTLTARLQITDMGADGVVTGCGSFSAGGTLSLKDNLPEFHDAFFETADTTITGTEPLPRGEVELKAEFIPDGGRAPAAVRQRPARRRGASRPPERPPWGGPFEVSRDPITAIDPADRDEGKRPFTGPIERVEFAIVPTR